MEKYLSDRTGSLPRSPHRWKIGLLPGEHQYIDEFQNREKYGGREIEKNTLTDLANCSFEGVGISRFFDRDEINELFRPFRRFHLGYEERIENVGISDSMRFAQYIVTAEK